jgi:cysteinyl-tRNA synthetase
LIKATDISFATLQLLKEKFKIFLEDIFGLTTMTAKDNGALGGVMDLLIEIRKEAKAKKDFATSDKIRNQLTSLGIMVKDEKDGGTSWSVN